MKFKNWVTATLLLITAGFILALFFTDNIILHIVSVLVALINVMLVTRYGKICEQERN